ncbi:MAG: DNA repair protein RecN [Egibacteraceae bacterium]
MLEELRIRNLGVIEDVTLPLRPGLNVLTGETGAGKTMVVSALQLLLGARAGAELVRSEASVALVEASVRPVPPSACEWVEPDEDALIVAREVAADGSEQRSRARLSGRLAPASALARVLGAVVEVHAQADTARLSGQAEQRDLLDAYGGRALAEAAVAYREAWRGWQEAASELDELTEGARERARETDRLAFELAEIDALAPRPGEEDELDGLLARLEHAEELMTAALRANAALADEGGARDGLGAAVSALRTAADLDPILTALRGRAESLAAQAQELMLDLEAYAGGVELDPQALEAARERRGALQGLVRKYGADAAAVSEYAQRARTRLAALHGGDERVAVLEQDVTRLRSELTAAAEALRAQRQRAASSLADVAGEHLDELAMAGVRLQVEVAPSDPAAHGADRVSFLLAGPAGPALPLARAASGGERSRVALAVRLALADADQTPILVFDEIDAGIGGATARAVGEKLARLARGRQVLCVTHLAQLAAFSDTHFVVAKGVADASERADGAAWSATVSVLDEAERITELARMLSGSPDSRAALSHAHELRRSAVAAVG